MVPSGKGPEGGRPQGQAEGTRMHPILPWPGIRGALTCSSQVSTSQARLPGCPGCSVLPEPCGCDLSGGLAEKGRGLWTVSRGTGDLGNQRLERWAAGAQGTGGEAVRKKHGTQEGKTAAAADLAQESGGRASTVRATLLSAGVGAAAPPHTARLPAPSGEGRQRRRGGMQRQTAEGRLLGVFTVGFAR